MVLEDRGGLLEGVVGRDTAVGPDLEDELVVVGDLADAGGLDRVFHEAHGREQRVDGDHADGLLFLLVGFAGIVAASGLDLDLGLEGALVIERANHLVGIDDRDVGIGLDVGSGDRAGLGRLDEEIDRLTLGGDDQDFLQVEDDVGDILDHAVD